MVELHNTFIANVFCIAPFHKIPLLSEYYKDCEKLVFSKLMGLNLMLNEVHHVEENQSTRTQNIAHNINSVQMIVSNRYTKSGVTQVALSPFCVTGNRLIFKIIFIQIVHFEDGFRMKTVCPKSPVYTKSARRVLQPLLAF